MGGVSGIWPHRDTSHKICCYPPVRSNQQGLVFREMNLLQPSNGHGGSNAGQQCLRDRRSNATRQGKATCLPSSCHHMTTRPYLINRTQVLASTARGKQIRAATPNDASSSPEAFCQPAPGDLDHQNVRAASQQVGDASQRHREPSSPARLSGSQPEQTPSSRTSSAQPDRAHFKPGEVLKQSSKRSIRRRNAKEVVIDVAGEAVPDDSYRRGCSASPMLRRSDISPGDPMEEGWVADTHNDARAQHWMSESSTSTPVAWSGSVFLRGSSGGLSSAGLVDQDDRSGWGGRPSHTSDGGGRGGGSGSGPTTAEGDNQGDSAATATVIVYTFLVAVLLFFWTNIYIVISRPEKIGTLGKKIAKVMSSAHWRVKQLQRQKSVAAAAPLKTRYRTLTVYKSGYSRLARRLISPAPAVDVETADGQHIDRDSAYTSMFLEVPRPQVFAHPVSLRCKSAARRTDRPSSSQWLPALDSSPSLTSLPSARFSPSMLGGMRGSTPFDEEASSGTLLPVPSLQRASGPLSSSLFLEDSETRADDEATLGTPSPQAFASQEAGGFSSVTFDPPSLTFDTPSPWPQPSPLFRRHATWTGCLDMDHPCGGTGGRTVPGCLDQETEEGHEFRDLQRHFVSNLLPGSLARVSLQRHSASVRQEISPYTAPPSFQRTKSQPIESEEQQHDRQHGAVRRSASLHSIRDVLGRPCLSNAGAVLDAHRLTDDLEE